MNQKALALAIVFAVSFGADLMASSSSSSESSKSRVAALKARYSGTGASTMVSSSSSAVSQRPIFSSATASSSVAELRNRFQKPQQAPSQLTSSQPQRSIGSVSDIRSRFDGSRKQVQAKPAEPSVISTTYNRSIGAEYTVDETRRSDIATIIQNLKTKGMLEVSKGIFRVHNLLTAEDANSVLLAINHWVNQEQPEILFSDVLPGTTFSDEVTRILSLTTDTALYSEYRNQIEQEINNLCESYGVGH